MRTAMIQCKDHAVPFGYPGASSMYAHSYVGVETPHEMVVERTENGKTVQYRHPMCNVLKYWWEDGSN